MELKNINIDSISEEYFGIKQFDSEIYNSLHTQIKLNGQLKNIIVMKKDKYIIVDGYYVFKIMKELGYTTIWAKELPYDEIALKHYVLQMELTLKHDFILIAKLIDFLIKKNVNINNICASIRFLPNELIGYERLLTYDFSRFSEKIHLTYYSKPDNTFF